MKSIKLKTKKNYSNAVKEYDAKVDTKKRVAIRSSVYDYYHITEFDDGRVLLAPRILVSPYEISENTLDMMDKSIDNMKKGKVSPVIEVP